MIFRTDIAYEAVEADGNSEGIKCKRIPLGEYSAECVEVLTDTAAKRLNKKKGMYISIESDAFLNRDVERYSGIAEAVRDALIKLCDMSGTVLVVGLGNSLMTPDSIGPKVVDKILVTRHIYEFLPDQVDKRMGCVCAVKPGVLGVTGIESASIIQGICEKVNVSTVIVIDALASRRRERMFSTVQLTDTGIEPGAGVGNKRSALTRESLNVPVIAIGVPTVIYSSSLISDALERAGVEADESVFEDDMVVTPKEIDVIVKDCAGVIADGINLALNKLSKDEITAYMF